MAIRSGLLEKRLLQRISERIGAAPVQITLGNESFCPPHVRPVAAVTVPDRATLMSLMVDPEVAFGEAYANGRVRVEGDLVRFLEAVYKAFAGAPAARSRYTALKSRAMQLWQDNTLGGSRDNVHHHYDLGNDFYKLWLDRELVYTCAYFPTPSVTLEQAQRAKMDYVCRKLCLQPGETVVEAGCGWGALALHMARNFGVSVKAFNVSHEQIAYARERARQEGLDSRVEFVEDDYRNVSGRSDVFVSVGMLEHVGLEHYAELGKVIHRSIGDSGRGFLHFLGRTYPAPLSRWIRKRIFPGAYVPTLRQALTMLEPWKFAVQDVENLRWHYAKTMEHWLQRFEASKRQVEAMYDAEFVRAWRLYLAGSLAAFRTGTLQLFQVVFTGAQCQPISWTRARLYATENSEAEEGTWTHAMS
ncbi:MAG TPA: cyclopropane-fatty-acyl-phospholipid synthase family protein [Bryobacteraceae bacterium]|nr:cyclopropane-fatty-acyl-phospholipid synthase family protein [Bryobacteraceae bacterium]